MSDQHEIGTEVTAGLHQPTIHHRRADITQKTERREKPRDITLGESHHPPVVADRAANETIALPFPSRAVTPDLKVVHDQKPQLTVRHHTPSTSRMSAN